MFSWSLIRNEKGLTLVELMVAFAIFAIVTAAVVSFYKFQSREGISTARKKLAEETVRLAMMTMTKDILQAGLGLEGRENLGLFVQRGETAPPPANRSPTLTGSISVILITLIWT